MGKVIQAAHRFVTPPARVESYTRERHARYRAHLKAAMQHLDAAITIQRELGFKPHGEKDRRG